MEVHDPRIKYAKLFGRIVALLSRYVIPKPIRDPENRHFLIFQCVFRKINMVTSIAKENKLIRKLQGAQKKNISAH